MKNGKIWGTTEEIFGRNNVEVHRIEVIAGGYCSEHHHEQKWNEFYVESGELQITQWSPSSGLKDITTLHAGDSTAVSPGVIHQFHALTEVVAFEIYWVALEGEDIVRRTVGGIDGRAA